MGGMDGSLFKVPTFMFKTQPPLSGLAVQPFDEGLCLLFRRVNGLLEDRMPDKLDPFRARAFGLISGTNPSQHDELPILVYRNFYSVIAIQHLCGE